MPNDQTSITDNARITIQNYFDLAEALQSWRPENPYPFRALYKLLKLDNKAEYLILQIEAVSAQRNRFLIAVNTIRTSLQSLGGARLANYTKDRLAEIWTEGQQAFSPSASLWRDRMTEVFQIQELINSSMLVVSADERDDLLSIWTDGVSLIDDTWRLKVVI